MHLVMKLGNRIVDQRFVSLKKLYEEEHIQIAIKEMIEWNEASIEAADEQPVFMLEDLSQKNANKNPPRLFMKTIRGFFKADSNCKQIEQIASLLPALQK